MFAYLSSYFSSIWNSIFGPLLMLTSLRHNHPQKSGRLLVLGLDNAGKTTLLQAIRRLDTTTAAVSNKNNSNTTTTDHNTHLRSYPPTDRPEHIKNIVTINNQITFHAYDLGGHEAVRHLWSDYYGSGSGSSNNNNDLDATNTMSDAATSLPNHNNNSNNLAILFCIDIADRQRVDEAAYELDALIHDGLNANNNNDNNNDHQGDTTKMGIPIAILLTKCDDMHENTTVNHTHPNHNSSSSTTTTAVPLIMTLPEVCQLIDYPSLQHSHNGPMHICTVSVYKNTGYIEALQWITKTLVRQQQQQQHSY